MILVNLLPDLRQAKLRERRRRQLVSGIAVVVWAVCGGIVALMSIYAVGQKAYISNVTHQIKNKEDDLKSMPDLIAAMTADQHISSLSNLYGKRVYLTKFFEAFEQADPQDVSVVTMAVDANNVLSVSGISPTYAEAAKIARSMEACHVKVCAGASQQNSPYFTNVNLGTVSSPNRGHVEFTLSATVAPGATSLGN